MKGNVSLYELNMKDVMWMLEGQVIPNPVALLMSVLVITFIGSMSLPKDWLKSTLWVQQQQVYEAFLWLKENNTLYGDICIEEDRLQLLLEDGVPEEVISLILQNENGDIADCEQGSYVHGFEVEMKRGKHAGMSFLNFQLQTYMNKLITWNRYYWKQRSWKWKRSWKHFSLQFLGVEDIDVNQLLSNELFLHVLVNLKNDDKNIEGGYEVWFGKDPVFDLPIAIQEIDDI